jgi:hypothetical protein
VLAIVKSNQNLNSITSALRRIHRHTGGIAKLLSGVVVLVSFIASSIILVLFFASFIVSKPYFEQQHLFAPPPPQESQQLQDNGDVSNTPVLYSVKIMSPVQGQSILINSQSNFDVIGTSTLPAPLEI